jgi:hypothetical protein
MAGRIAYYGGIVTNGLVLDLDAAKRDSYPGSGTTWFDIGGLQYNGTLVNGPTFDPANAGSVVFDGTNDYLVRTDASLRNYTTVTANIWMNVTSSNAWETYFSYNAEEAGLTQGWGIRRQSNSPNYQYWGGTGNSGIKLYKNGTLISSGNASSVVAAGFNITGSWGMITLVATGVSSWNTTNNFTLATRSDNLGSATNMKAGSFSLYNRELSAAEITQNYNALKGRYGL